MMMMMDEGVAILLEASIKKDDTTNLEEMLETFTGSSCQEFNPLLLAREHGSTKCATEIVRLRPDFARAMESDGYSAMHKICQYGDVGIVKILVESDHQLCLVKDVHHSRTPLHVAAINGHFGCFQVLMAQLVDNMPMINLKAVLNHKDYEGNTLLHIATERKQIQILKLLLSDNPTIASMVEKNAKNGRGLTALDLHCQNASNTDGIDTDITDLLLLQAGGAKVEYNLPICIFEMKKIIAANDTMHKSMLKSMLLTVFILVAGGTYASLFSLNTIYPQEEYINNTHGSRISKHIISLKDMLMIRRVHFIDLFFFIVLNTVAFNGSVAVIVATTWSLVSGWSLCFRAIPLVVFGAMCGSYSLLVNKIIPHFWVKVGSLEISSFWFVWLFNLPIIFFTVTVWVGLKRIICKASYNLGYEQAHTDIL